MALDGPLVGLAYSPDVQIDEAYVMLMAVDMDRALRFWRDGLGLSPRSVSPFWSELTLGTTVVALHGGASEGQGVPAVLGLRVGDIDLAVAAVRDAGGIVVEGPEPKPEEGIALAECADPEGNRFFLSSPLA